MDPLVQNDALRVPSARAPAFGERTDRARSEMPATHQSGMAAATRGELRKAQSNMTGGDYQQVRFTDAGMGGGGGGGGGGTRRRATTTFRAAGLIVAKLHAKSKRSRRHFADDAPGPKEEWVPPTTLSSIKHGFLGSKFNILLVFVVIGVVSKFVPFSDPLIFTFNFLAILPLAKLLGEATEEIALRTSETTGALLNATLGNATELIISIFAIKEGLLRVVQVSLLGSILSNSLLVLGCCFFFGHL